MTTWQCEVCGYIHTGEKPPVTCPVCDAEQELFHILEIHRESPAPVRADTWQCGICDHLHQGAEPPEVCPVCGAKANLFTPRLDSDSPALHPTDIRRLVVLGAGIAGLTAATEARRQSAEVTITLVSRETPHPYYRLNLTRFLAGEVPEGNLVMQPPRWFEEQRIELMTAEATAIDREQRQVRLRDGRQLPYDRLVLANGAHPFIPPIPGATREGVQVLRTLEDARTILERLAHGKRVVCIGGGLLGLETAGALARRGATVTVVEGFAWLLPRQLTPRAGKMLQERLVAQGLSVSCGVAVRELTGDESVRGVLLENGEELPADFVVIAAGVRPNSHLARQSGLKVHGGVVVDDRMFTSDPAILAAGDVAEHRGRLYGIWPAGFAQGVIAGSNAVGGQAEFSGTAPSTRIKVLDVDLFSIGQIQPEDASTKVCEETRDGAYSALFSRDGQLAGAVLYGDTSRAGLLKEVVESGRQVSEFPELVVAFPELAG
jgi:nitrite reductase (NADH) large subunit